MNTGEPKNISKNKKWSASILIKKKRVHIGCFYTEQEAIKSRNGYIRENGLPDKIQEVQSCITQRT